MHSRIVSDATLSSRIASVRHAIGDTGEGQLLLGTVQTSLNLSFDCDPRRRCDLRLRFRKGVNSG
jgi:hypothetical protein